MAGSPKEKLTPEEETAQREVYLKDGRKVVVGDDLVEIRSESGMLELRIKLTEEGPVLQMESVRMQLKASESVEIQSKRVELTASETVVVEGKGVKVEAEEDLDLEAGNEARVRGKMIYLN